jgi:hypothetical protein
MISYGGIHGEIGLVWEDPSGTTGRQTGRTKKDGEEQENPMVITPQRPQGSGGDITHILRSMHDISSYAVLDLHWSSLDSEPAVIPGFIRRDTLQCAVVFLLGSVHRHSIYRMIQASRLEYHGPPDGSKPTIVETPHFGD